jgi:putative ABC transport system substrate-binding protein
LHWLRSAGAHQVSCRGHRASADCYLDFFRRAAAFVDSILKGAKPENLPIQQPATYDLVINPRVAKALGIAVPNSILFRADEVIES